MSNASASIHAGHLSPEGEADLIRRIRGGDQAACTQLVALFTPRMMAVARRFLCCDDDCNDALQDAYISAFRSLAGFEGVARLSTWLHRITVNCCLMRLRSGSARRGKRIGEWLQGFDDHVQRTRECAGLDPAAEAEIDEARQIVHRAIELLPEPYREVLLLRDIEQMDTMDTAARLNITVHNVKRRLQHARQSLGSLLEEMMADGDALSANVRIGRTRGGRCGCAQES